MLHFETVDPGTLSLLNQLMQMPELSQFSLVGGTALSLRYGHRKSIDLDLFSTKDFDHNQLVEALQSAFRDGFSFSGFHNKWGLFCSIAGVKVDIVYYPHENIQSVDNQDNIRLYGDDDLMAMKVNAILGRGRKKDFWDVYELLHHHSLQRLMDCYYTKFPKQMLCIAIPHALTYFVDAEESEEPVSLKGQTWDSVKDFISLKVRDYLA